MYPKLLLLSLILIIIGQTPLIRPVRAVSARVANPLQYGVYQFSQGLRGGFDFIAHLRRLRAENLMLEENLLELEATLAVNKELEQENEILREQMGEEFSGPELVLAEIVGRSAGDGEAVLIINRGSAAGIRSGAAVVLKNFLLGEVFAVESERAKVRLLTDPQFSTAVLDQDSPDRTRGLVSGQYGTVVLMQKVLPTESLAVGDTVITSGEDGKFEKGLILGKVKKILGQEADVFKGAELQLMVDFDLLEEVFIYEILP